MNLNYRALRWTLLLTGMLVACGDDDSGGNGAGASDSGTSSGSVVTHAEALQALSKGACAISSCHGSSAEGGLRLDNATDLSALLVGKPACEAPSLKLVEPGAPDKSWLWIKLTADHDSSGALKAQSSWGEVGSCPGSPGVGFGHRMPDVQPYMWTASGLDIVEGWIKGGAPGPM